MKPGSFFKRGLALAALAVIALLSGCGQVQADGGTYPTQATEAPATVPATQAPATAAPAAKAPGLTLPEAFRAALLGETPLAYIDQDRSEVYRAELTLAEITAEDNQAMSPAQFAVMDLDGDGSPEVVYQRSDYLGFIVLRHLEGRVLGCEIPYRGMNELKQDGTCVASSGAWNTRLGRIRFEEDRYVFEDLAYSDGPENIYEGGEKIGEARFIQLLEDHTALPDAPWRLCTPDGVAMWLGRDLEQLQAES